MNPAESSCSSFSDSFCKSFLLNSVDQSLRKEVLESPQLLKNFREALEADFKERLALNSDAILSARCKHFNIQGTQPDDYLERVMIVSSSQKALTGIRFFNSQREEPFIDVWPDWPIDSLCDLTDIIKSIRLEFSVFSPKSIALWLDPERFSQPQSVFESAKIGQVVLGAHHESILAHLTNGFSGGKIPHTQNAKLKPIYSMDFYDKYTEAYEAFHSSKPHLRNKVPKTSPNDFERSIAQNLAFHFSVDDEEAGVIAGERRNYIGFPGIYFLELFLYEKFRGKHLAPIVQRLFVETANKDPRAFIWGTIDSQNKPSLRTGLSLGRKVISQEVFLPIS